MDAFILKQKGKTRDEQFPVKEKRECISIPFLYS